MSLSSQAAAGQYRNCARAELEIINHPGLLSGAPQFRLDELRAGRPVRSRVSHLAPE